MSIISVPIDSTKTRPFSTNEEMVKHRANFQPTAINDPSRVPTFKRAPTGAGDRRHGPTDRGARPGMERAAARSTQSVAKGHDRRSSVQQFLPISLGSY